MKSSFKDADQVEVAAPPAEEITTSTALAVQPEATVVPDGFFSNDAVEGDFDRSDIKVPRLNLVQSVGPLSGELGFTPGRFVFNKEVDLGSEGLKITLIHLKKYLLEDLAYGSETMPRFFKSMDDARRAGFLPIADKKTMGEEHKYAKPVLDADVLIEGKPGVNDTFPFDFNGTPYAMARWTLQSTAYSRVGKSFFTDSQFALKAGLSIKFYSVSAKREKIGVNWVFCPRVQIAGKNSDEFIAWIKSVTV